MKRFRIEYSDCGEIDASVISASDYEEAEEKFWDSIIEWQGDSKGIEIISIKEKGSRKDSIKRFYQ